MTLPRIALFCLLLLTVGLIADACIPPDNGFLGYAEKAGPVEVDQVCWFPGRGIIRGCRRIHQRRLERGVAVFGQGRYNASCSSCYTCQPQYRPAPRYSPPSAPVYDYPNRVQEIGAAGRCSPSCPRCQGRGCGANCQCPPQCVTLPDGSKVCTPCRQPASQVTNVSHSIGATIEAEARPEPLATPQNVKWAISCAKTWPEARPQLLKLLEDNVLTKPEYDSFMRLCSDLNKRQAEATVKQEIDAFRAETQPLLPGR